MLDLSRDIRSLSEFKRNTNELVEQMKATGNPVVLTINGKAEIVVQDAEAYQRLLDEREEAQALQGIRRGLEDVRQGRTRPARQALEQIRKKHRIPRK
jgi:prevent-host-death family protein